jgi:hypothetical protein
MTPEQVVQSTIICMVMIMLHLLVIATTCVYVFGTSHEKMVAWASMMTSFVTYIMLLIALPLIQVCKQ